MDSEKVSESLAEVLSGDGSSKDLMVGTAVGTEGVEPSLGAV